MPVPPLQSLLVYLRRQAVARAETAKVFEKKARRADGVHADRHTKMADSHRRSAQRFQEWADALAPLVGEPAP